MTDAAPAASPPPQPTAPTLPLSPLAAWFLGPRAENAEVWEELLSHILSDYVHWRRNYFPVDPVIVGRARRRSPEHQCWLDSLTSTLDGALNELKHHFPFHSPRYIGHMLSEQTLPSFLGFFSGLLYNPNNVTDEAAPVTVALELEVGRMVSAMLGYNPRRAWAHITSGGTIAHLEALWVARSAQFVPFFVRDFCATTLLDFNVKRADQAGVKRADQADVPISSLSPAQLLGLRPNESIFMLRKLVRSIHQTTGRPIPSVLAEVNQAFADSPFNVAKAGYCHVLAQLGLRPVLLVSSAHHYSLLKAANVLGYGEKAVRLVPVTPRFQIDVDALHDALYGLSDDEYIAAVVGIVGTTEEGAVDPIHRIRFLRDDLERDKQRSFWLHVDAAWGGYIRSLFCEAPLPHLPRGTGLIDICDAYVRGLRMEETLHIPTGVPSRSVQEAPSRWADRDVYASFLAIADADSIIVDPHKMGYVPYPAGMVAFRNGLVTELIQQRAQYISSDEGGLKGIDELPHISSVGGYILEGSKPGAVALSCWLAHKSIPLTYSGHGQIVKTSLLSTKRLFKYLVNHRHAFAYFHHKVFGLDASPFPFSFFPLYEPDTNILCFIARPMSWQAGLLRPVDTTLSDLNRLNERVYDAASIPAAKMHDRTAASQPFFLSRTDFQHKQYSTQSLTPLLNRLDISPQEYRKGKLFALRCAVMNPWYHEAQAAGCDYLLSFVEFLHKVTAVALDELQRAKSNLGSAAPSPSRA